MKKYKIALGSFIVSALFLASCQDIDLLPKDNLPDESFWKTPDDFEKECNWLYTRTETFGTKDTDSDIAYELQENTTSNGTLIAPNADALWDSCYIDLRQCNMIIEKGATYEGDASEIERYIAEARFFRAYTHWRLMDKYNDIPILTKVLSVDSPELYSSRSKQEEVENFILSELEEIWPQLPLKSELTEDAVAKACGPTDVVVCNHHAYKDAMHSSFISQMQAKAYVVPVWDYYHPESEPLKLMLSDLYPGDRMVFAAGLVENNRIRLGENGEKIKPAGHIMVRVYEGGKTWQVFVLNDTSTDYNIIYKTDILQSK